VGLDILTELGVLVSCNTGVVDEQLNTLWLLLLNLLDQSLDVILVADISGQWQDLARSGAVLLDGVLQLVLASTGDVDLGSVCNECLGDHETNAGSTTSDDSGDMGDVEKSVSGELMVLLLA